ncbi:Ig-like domain-containing protein [Paenarthrobacter sp. NPDC056912]|uniref:Ig-like domain-containing protein n=1 Tax=Paenarthrobacter sp. NPDC056912 TaxID=3345965 RepID=UPI003671025E
MTNQIHLKTASLVAALLAAVMTFLGMGMSALPANAAVIPGAVVSINTDSAVTGQWDQVDLTCTWSVPDNSQPGDTFSLQLPPELRWFGAASFDLDNADGESVAKAVANDSGLVVFTLTDFVASHPLNIGGMCNFTTQYSSVPGNGGITELSFIVGSTVVRMPLVLEGPCTTDCGPVVPTSAGKAMWWADAGQTELESIFYMPPMAAETNDVVVTDTPAAGMEIDCDQITPRVGQVLNTDGNITEPFDNEQFPATIECTPQKATVSWTGLPKGEHVELFVVTKVTDSTLDVYDNNGTIIIAGQETTVGAQTRRSTAGGTGGGTATPSPTPSPATSTATPSPTPSPATNTATPSPTPSPTTSTATPTTSPTPIPSAPTLPPATTPSPSATAPTASPSASPSTTAPILAVVVPTEEPSLPADVDDSEELASTGAQGSAFVFIAAALLAVGSMLAFAGSRWTRRRAH